MKNELKFDNSFFHSSLTFHQSDILYLELPKQDAKDF